MKQTRILVPTLLSALLGGVVVAVLFSVTDMAADHVTTTVVEQGPLTRGAEANTQREGLTANQIYRRDAPGVVNVRAEIVRQVDSPFDLNGSQPQGEATGSGFVVDKDGTILTNAHVIE